MPLTPVKAFFPRLSSFSFFFFVVRFSLSSFVLHPHLSLSVCSTSKWAAWKNKGEELYIVPETEWKLRAVSDNWACLKRHVNNRQGCGRHVTPCSGWQTLSAVDELFRGEIVPGKQHRYYELASCLYVYPIQLELTESNWPGHVHTLYFLYSHQQCA